MLFAIAAICVILSLLYIYFFEIKLARIKKLTSNMPSPRSYPVIGSALEFGNRSDEILQGFCRIIKAHGPVVSVWLGSELYVILSGVNEIQTILSNNSLLTKAHVYEFLWPWLGSGLLSSDGDEWRRQRKVITPAFHFKILEQFVDMFASNINILTGILKQHVGKPGIDVTNYIQLCALDIISETSMGTKINAQLQKESKLACAINECAMTVLHRAIKPWLFPTTFFNLSAIGRKFNSNVKLIDKAIQELVQEKRKLKAELKSQNIEEHKETLVYGSDMSILIGSDMLKDLDTQRLLQQSSRDPERVAYSLLRMRGPCRNSSTTKHN